MKIEPWWMLIPFALVLVPPIGVLLVTVALCRATGGLRRDLEFLGDRRMARRMARYDRNRVAAPPLPTGQARLDMLRAMCFDHQVQS